MQMSFPKTQIENIEVSRLIIGCNWISGFSHRTFSQDKMIKDRHYETDLTVKILETFLSYDINCILGLLDYDSHLTEAIKQAERAGNKKMIIIDEPVFPVDDTREARTEAQRIIQESARRGTKICMPLHSVFEQLLNKNTHKINRIEDYLYMIREAGMIPGASAHMPEIIEYCDENNYDVQTYIQIYNCQGFLMQRDVEATARLIHNARKPVLTIKSMAAGRVSPFVGLNFVWNTIRSQDMVAVGCFTEKEALEDIEYSLAALQKRMPDTMRPAATTPARKEATL